MTPAQAIALNSTGTPIFLAEVTVGNRYLFFIPASSGGNVVDNSSTQVVDNFANDVVSNTVDVSYVQAYDSLAISWVEANGVQLTAQTSLANVIANGGWYNDGTYTYINPVPDLVAAGQSFSQNEDGSFDFFDFLNNSVQAFYTLYFANNEKNFNGNYYRPGILSLPALSTKLEKKFSSVAEISGGDMRLNNEDKYLDTYREMQWDAGTTTIKFGWDFEGFTMAYADYEQVANFINSARVYDEADFTLKMLDNKNRLKVKIPLTYYANQTPSNPIPDYTYLIYPNMESKGNGKPVPIAYGINYGSEPICIDQVNKIFQLASHACFSLDAVRIYDSTNNGWDETTPTLIDLTGTGSVAAYVAGLSTPPPYTIGPGCYFQLGSDWSGNKRVSCDFKGKLCSSSAIGVQLGKISAGTFMTNAADIIADLLTEIGEGPNMSVSSFETAWALLDFGSYGNLNPVNNQITVLKPNLFINSAVTVVDMLNIINAFVASFVYVDANGEWNYTVFDPQNRSGLPSFDDSCLNNWTDQTEQILGLSSVNAPYASRITDGWAQFLTYGVPPNKFIHKQLENTDTEDNLPTSSPSDANLWAQRKLLFEGKTSRVFQGDIVRADGLLLRPGGQIHIYWGITKDSNGNIIAAQYDKVMDIIQISFNFEPDGSGGKTATTTVYCSNLRGWDDQPGFWTSDTPTFPAAFSSLSGYGTGSADPWNKNWHPILKAYARQTFGYWCSDRGNADDTDPASNLGSCWV